MNTSTSWGEEYDRIKERLGQKGLPPTDRAQRMMAALFSQLEQRFAELPEREQRIFRYVFLQALGAKATTFQTLIDVFEGRCQSPDEAIRMASGYMDTALQS